MKLQLKNGIELEIPGDAQVEVSEDGKKVVIKTVEPKVVEKIRVVERIVPGPETVRFVEIEKPCTRRHYDYYYGPYNTAPYTVPTWGTITVGSTDGGSYTIGGLPGGNATGGLVSISNNSIT